ncbi:MAG TPA: NAD(P)/FAD-dependent oxidoreductase [Fimbriimonas sp.]|nr:NAD(P)/FAD-dependent oxidoreductase [Fimbriimonas sp.]
MKKDVVIVGAWLAGLSCAQRLQSAGVDYLILDASDAVGGRIRTDEVDGFLLDRGFQVFLTSYPEAQQMLDLEALKLKPFLPGAQVRCNGEFYTMSDPWRQPLASLGSVFSPIGTFADKLRVAQLRSRSLNGSLDELWQRPETTTLATLQGMGFSQVMIDRFFRPFLGGIFLDSDLQTSSRMFDFVFRMFSLGSATLPASGIEAIPRQLATGLPNDRIRLGTRVQSIQEGAVRLDNGDEIHADAIVIATEGPNAVSLLGDTVPKQEGQGVTCFYFAADQPPTESPMLMLNGDGRGPINNLCVPTVVAPTYGPVGQSLISATVLGVPSDLAETARQVQTQMSEWFGTAALDWRHLRTYAIPYALPRQTPPALKVPQREVRIQPGVYVCGDHRDNASINGALVSGRRAVEAVLADAK